MKKEIFLHITKILNVRLNIIPLLFGSVGLEQRLDTSLNSDDIDILIPEKFLGKKWDSIIEIMTELGYKLYDAHEHAFENDELSVAFASIENLMPFAGVNIAEIPVVCENNAWYYLLELEDYLKVYTASAKDGYRKDTKNKNDSQKIILIRRALKNK